jgi:hypothetical protein
MSDTWDVNREDKESISPTHWHKAKSHWCTAFGKKIAIQFHQHFALMKFA